MKASLRMRILIFCELLAQIPDGLGAFNTFFCILLEDPSLMPLEVNTFFFETLSAPLTWIFIFLILVKIDNFFIFHFGRIYKY